MTGFKSMYILAMTSILMALALISGCSAQQTVTADAGGVVTVDETTTDATVSNTGASSEISGIDFSYSDRDMDASYDAATATTITLAQSGSSSNGEGVVIDGSSVTINAEGTYILSGALTDGYVVVDADAEAKIQLVLDGISITNSNGPALLVEQADKVFITLAEGSSNTLSDSADRSDLIATSADGAEEDHASHDATLFSHDDLAINGSGALTVRGNSAHAIVSKDDLIITGGDFTLQAVTDTLQAKDCLKILAGSFNLDAGDDAITATATDDATAGFVSIDGGSFTISAQGDAIHAETALRITGGTAEIIESNEGLEAAWIQFQGGEFRVTSSDDGLNAASDVQANLFLEISGGYLYVDAEGDGLDSNGTFTQTSGTVIVCGPVREGNGALDYMGTANISGGSLLAVGTSGMAQGIGSSSSAQASILYSPSSTIEAGTIVALVDSQGELIFSFKTPKDFSSLAFSSDKLVVGNEYSIITGATISGAEKDGFWTEGTISGGTEITGFTLSQTAAAVSADGSVSEMAQGGMGGMGGGPDGANDRQGKTPPMGTDF